MSDWPARPPGTILLQRYVRERIRLLRPGRFVEIGCGSGQISRLLLEEGWSGVAYDLNPAALEEARRFSQDFIDAGRLELRLGDWMSAPEDERFELVISCLVVEHLSDQEECAYFAKAKKVLSGAGRVAFVVPGAPDRWGIEDEIAGHLRRYDRDLVRSRLAAYGLRECHIAGLTFPLSNLVLPLSNWLVARHEGEKRALTAKQQTIESGKRSVPFKTVFPNFFALVLNDVTLYPFHMIQKLFKEHRNCLILYVEAVPG